MVTINYLRHFAVLGSVTVLWIGISLINDRPVLGDGFYFFALIRALHSASLVSALRGSVSVPLKAVFIGGAAVLSTAVPFIGLFTVGALPFEGELVPYVVFGVASATGAFTYGLLAKSSVLRGLSLRALFAATILCPVATVLVLAIHEHLPRFHDGLWLTVAWWVTFSLSLFFTLGSGIAANKRLQETPTRERS